jgi:hypothetical protein
LLNFLFKKSGGFFVAKFNTFWFCWSFIDYVFGVVLILIWRTFDWI